MGERVVKSFNLWIDTDRGDLALNSKGDDYELNLNSVNIECMHNQMIRLSLNAFSMYKTWTNINVNNSKFKFVANNGTADVSGTADLSYTNFSSHHDLIENFANALGAAAISLSTTLNSTDNSFNISNQNPIANTSIAGTTNFIGEFDLIFTRKDTGAAVAHGLTNPIIQFYDHYDNNVISDIYSILGGDRIRENGSTSTSTTASIDCSVKDANTLHIKCKYPSQLFSEQFVYLSLPNINTGNIETQSFRDANNKNHNNNIAHHSNLFARFPQDHLFVNYLPSHEREYFVDLQQKHLNTLRLRLTDSHGRGLPYVVGQNVNGNLNFSAVIRVDIIEKFSLEDAQRALLPQNFPKRYNNLINDFNGHTL